MTRPHTSHTRTRDWTAASSLLPGLVVGASAVVYVMINEQATVVFTLVLAGSAVMLLAAAVSPRPVRMGLVTAAATLLGLHSLATFFVIVPALAAVAAFLHAFIARGSGLDRRSGAAMLIGLAVGATAMFVSVLLAILDLNPQLRG